METAVKEVSILMKDSFLRFKQKDNAFDKCLELTMTHRHSKERLHSKKENDNTSSYSSLNVN